MNLHSLESFAFKGIPLYGEHLKYEEKVKKIKIRLKTLKFIKSTLEHELSVGGVYKKSQFKPLTKTNKENITAKIQMLDQRIGKLKKKIQKESVESSMAMVGQVTGSISNSVAPGSGILIAGATAAIRAGHHNYQPIDVNEPTRSMVKEAGKAMLFSTLGRIVGVAKVYLNS